MYHSIRPGKYWYDTAGKLIQAHGGSILCDGGCYYWYGENKEGVTGLATGEACPIWHQGVRLYSSTDLYNWRDEGVILVGEGAPETPFHPRNIMDRPHILRNPRTGQYVLWAKIAGVLGAGADFGHGYMSVAVAETIAGPYKIVNCIAQPELPMGDFDLVQDGERAYIIYERPHTEMICQTLNEDYTDVTPEYSRHIDRGKPPFTREAPCYFTRAGRKFLIASGTTGYYPNATETFEIEDFHGEWRLIGKTCMEDRERNSFHAQFSSVFHVPGTDTYIATGDRWLTDLPPNMPDMDELYQSKYPRSADFEQRFPRASFLTDSNTSMARYVWLPVNFDQSGTPYIRWRDEWRVETANHNNE